MFCKVVVVVSLLFSRSCSSVEPSGSKLSDLDIQSCIDNFDIHKDKIIRTQDSRAMGAKYLNEIDLDSREECLRLCCETEDCDVFIYEEKNAGSCYLFQCGPPEDFKCKFTHHVNYTSAVLAVNRHLPDLESQIRLTKHEQDLSKLRKPEVKSMESMQMSQKVETTQSTSTTTRVAPVKTNTPPPSRKCSIYQFECRSTGECIAIYNACDGIPQCADGSDEAPELRCPETTTPPPVQSRLSPNSPPDIRTIPIEKQQANILQVQQTGEVYRPVVAQVAAPQSAPSDFLRPVSDPLRMHPYEPPQIPQYQQYVQPQPNWPPHQLPASMPRYADKNSHIFNHKESGFQVGDGGESSQIQYDDGGRDPKYSSYYGSEVYRQPVPQIKETWTNNQADYNKVANTNPYVQNTNPVVRDKWEPSVPVEKEVVNPKYEQERIAHELKHSKEHFKNASADNTEKANNQKSRPAADEDEHEHEKYAVVAEYKIAAEMIEDGVAETPGGAVLSLTLGIVITSLMGVLIACRLRVVRRRLRRGGKSYAHDADYLVNGMYL